MNIDLGFKNTVYITYHEYRIYIYAFDLCLNIVRSPDIHLTYSVCFLLLFTVYVPSSTTSMGRAARSPFGWKAEEGYCGVTLQSAYSVLLVLRGVAALLEDDT